MKEVIKMNKIYTLIISVLIIILLTGCNKNNSNKQIAEVDNSNSSSKVSETDNPFENEKDTVVLGSIGHRVPHPSLDKDGEPLPLEYDGGEVNLEYEVTAEGEAKNVGFLLFLDGVPQPYKINDTNGSYEYMHNLKLTKDNEPVNYNFIFTPITGKKGDTVNLTVTSIYFPEFIPNMKDTSSYGLYHSILPVEIPMKFNKDTNELDSSLYSQRSYLSDTQISTYPITNEFIKNELSSMYKVITEEDLKSDILTKIYYNGNQVMSNLKVEENEKMHITYKICGVPGAKYKTTFYINHHPIANDELISFNTTIEKGKVCVIDAEIDINQLNDLNTFYAISVPTNSKDYYNENVYLEKTSSILLYKDIVSPDTKDNKDYTPSSFDLTGIIDISNIEGKIKNISYGNNGNILVSSDKIYSYNLQNRSIISETKNSFLCENLKKIDNGYVAIGILKDDGNNGNEDFLTDNTNHRCIFYDENLKQTKVINISEVTGDNRWISTENITVSNDGKKLAYSTNKGLFLYDINEKNKTTLIDFTAENNAERLGIVGMRRISFADNGSKIAFTAESFDIPPIKGKVSFTTYGALNIDGTGLINKRKPEYNTSNSVIYDSFIVLMEDSRTPTGRLMTMDLSSEEERIYKLSSQKESSSIHCSELGRYFATSIIDTSNKRLVVRIYNMESGKLIKEEIIEDENSIYFNREPLIRIIDDSKICIVMLGNSQRDSIETKISAFNF